MLTFGCDTDAFEEASGGGVKNGRQILPLSTDLAAQDLALPGALKSPPPSLAAVVARLVGALCAVLVFLVGFSFHSGLFFYYLSLGEEELAFRCTMLYNSITKRD